MSTNPYVGPRAFRAGESLYGRDIEAVQLLNLILAERIVLLYSPSGAGKSSLLEAKLRPALTTEGMTVLPTIRVGERPDEIPSSSSFNAYLHSSLASLLKQGAAPASLASGTGSLQRHMDGLDKGQASPNSYFPVLFFDQFEEIFTRGAGTAAINSRVEFFEEIAKVLRKTNRWAVFAMREEFIAGIDVFSALVPTHFRNTFRLDYLRESQALNAVREPARNANVCFDKDAALHLVSNLSRISTAGEGGSFEPRQYVEPVHLQVVCLRLWDTLAAEGKLEDGRIDLRDVSGAGGEVDRALEGYYASSVAQAVAVSGLSERAIREWIESSLVIGKTRSQSRQGPSSGGSSDVLVLKALEDVYLIRQERRQEVSWYELAHDRLIEPVLTNNARWRQENLEEFQRRSQAWGKEGRPASLLLRGTELRKARRWAGENPALLTSLDKDLLKSSIRQGRRRFWTTSVIMLLIGIVVAAGLTILANNERQKSDLAQRQLQRERERAEAAEKRLRLLSELKQTQLKLDEEIDTVRLHQMVLAAQRARLEDRGDLAALLARQAYLEWEKREAKSKGDKAKSDSLESQSYTTDSLADSETIYRTLRFALNVPYFRHVADEPAAGVKAVAFEPLAKAVAWASGRKISVLRSFADGFGHPDAIEHETEVEAIAFSRDGKYLAVAGGNSVMVHRAGELGVSSAKRSVKGQVSRLAFFGADQSVRLAVASSQGVSLWKRGITGWGTKPWKAWPPAGAPPQAVHSISASPQGDAVALTAGDGRAYLWHPDATDVPEELPGQFEWCISEGVTRPVVAFNAAGSRLVVEGAMKNLDCNPRIVLWNSSNSPPEVLRWFTPSYRVRALAFAEDSVLAANAAGEIMILDLREPGPALPMPPTQDRLTGHRGIVRQLAYVQADGMEWIASAGEDALRLWSRPIPNKELLGSVRFITFPAEHSTVRVTLEGGAISTCNVSGLSTFNCTSPAGSDDPLQLARRTFGRSDANQALAVSPDRRWVAASRRTGASGRILLHHLTDQGATDSALTLRPEPGTKAIFTSLTLAGADAHIAAGTMDGKLRVWLAAAKEPARLLTSPPLPGGVTSLAFDRDGNKLVSGHETGRVLLWELGAVNGPRLPDPLELRAETDLTASVGALVFSPDGGYVVAGDEQGRLRRLELAPALADRVCQTVRRNLTQKEWDDFVSLPGTKQEYRCICPKLPPGRDAASTTPGCASVER